MPFSPGDLARPGQAGRQYVAVVVSEGGRAVSFLLCCDPYCVCLQLKRKAQHAHGLVHRSLELHVQRVFLVTP